MIKILAMAAAGLMATQVAAVTTIVPLGVIVVPPTQTTSPGVAFTANGTNSAFYEFTVSQPNTVGVSSFTNSAILGRGVFNFTSIGLYSGFGTGGSLLQSGTIGTRTGGTLTAFLDPYTFGPGTYTIAYTGNVSGRPASVGSSITFAAGAVPEPATWFLMVAGFGMVGFATRRRSTNTVAA